ncbi:MAG: peroxiredoxin [Gammaproteobacteria bacterium]|nr:peroxiredoxin [Gammaproteobacteria bacterium]NNF62440.1 peroxiredoxin [Gammaproteobacteria bacterium]NNM21387.1 peroxiredoxin [Gammaproteobacteria bacterium]
MRLFFSAIALCLFSVPALAGPPAVGEMAPSFELLDQKGKTHAVDDYRGKWVVMYFYPKDDTPGCTTEACAFRDDIFKFRKMGVSILGVSVDDVKSHAEFAEKYSLPFPLLADTDMTTTRAYGVLRNYGLLKLSSRQTFVIDPDGRIAKHYAKVDPDTHSSQLQADIAALVAGAAKEEQTAL